MSTRMLAVRVKRDTNTWNAGGRGASGSDNKMMVARTVTQTLELVIIVAMIIIIVAMMMVMIRTCLVAVAAVCGVR